MEYKIKPDELYHVFGNLYYSEGEQWYFVEKRERDGLLGNVCFSYHKVAKWLNEILKALFE